MVVLVVADPGGLGGESEVLFEISAVRRGKEKALQGNIEDDTPNCHAGRLRGLVNLDEMLRKRLEINRIRLAVHDRMASLVELDRVTKLVERTRRQHSFIKDTNCSQVL